MTIRSTYKIKSINQTIFSSGMKQSAAAASPSGWAQQTEPLGGEQGNPAGGSYTSHTLQYTPRWCNGRSTWINQKHFYSADRRWLAFKCWFLVILDRQLSNFQKVNCINKERHNHKWHNRQRCKLVFPHKLPCMKTLISTQHVMLLKVWICLTLCKHTKPKDRFIDFNHHTQQWHRSVSAIFCPKDCNGSSPRAIGLAFVRRKLGMVQFSFNQCTSSW